MAANDDATRPSPLFPLDVGWTTGLGGAPGHEPAYDDAQAYVPLRSGTLVAVALDTGDVRWSITQPTSQAPVAGDGVVIAADGRRLIALRVTDGRRVWTRDVGAEVSAPLVWKTGWLVAPLSDGTVVALRGSDGRALWRRRLDGPLRVRPSIAGNQLFVPIEDGRIAALDLGTGKPLWERALGGSPREILALDALFVGSTDNYFYRLSRDDGMVEWQWRTGGDIIGAARVGEDRVYFLSLDNLFRALDRRSGVQQWRQPLTGRPTAGPVTVADLLLVAGVAPEFRLFDAETGRDAGRYRAPAELGAVPYAVPGLPDTGPRLIVLTGDGRLIGLIRGTGPDRFTLAFPPPPLLPVSELLVPADVLPPPSPADPPVPAVTDPSLESVVGAFAVEVAVPGDAAAADLSARLRAAGFPAYVVPPSEPATGRRHRVRIGRGLARGEAEQLAARLERDQPVDAVVIDTRVPEP